MTSPGFEIVYFGGFKLPDRKARGVHAVLSCASLARAGIPVTMLLRACPKDPVEALAPYDVIPGPGLRILSGLNTKTGRLFGKGAGLKALTLAALLPRGREKRVVYTMDYPGLRIARSLFRLRRILGFRFVFELHNLTSTVLREEAERWARIPKRHDQLSRRAEKAGKVEAYCYPRMDGLVANSRGTLAAVEDTFGAPAHRIALPNGVDLARFQVADETPDVDLLYTGSLDGWKGVDTLIDALGLFEGVRLRVAGFGEPQVVEDFLERARRQGVRDRLDFLGYRPHREIPGLLARTRIVVVSTSGLSREGKRFTCPMKVLEAMGAGKPIVAADLPTIRELMDHEKEGLLFKPDDAESLARAIRKLLDDEGLSVRLATAARKRAEGYTWRQRTKRLIQFLEGVVREPLV